MNRQYLNRMEELKWDWPKWARPSQSAPPEFTRGQKRTWLILSGRGWGKTRVGAEQVREWAKTFDRVNLVGPTHDAVRDIMIQGESGVLAVCPRSERPRFISSRRLLEWPSGSVSQLFSADEPERLRGPQHSKMWCDELASWRNPEAWDQSQFGLRLGANPQCLVSTTPRPSAIIKALVKDPNTIVTRGTSYENASNLAAGFFNQIITRYEGSRLGKQELLGELLADREGALFFQSQIDDARVATAPELTRIVVGVDPAVTAKKTSDECGIVTVGKDARRPPHYYVIDDQSLQASPEKWARRVVATFYKHSADKVIGETNMGGDLIAATIHNVDTTVPFKAVRATRGKLIRAEPASALFEQGRVHFVGTFPQLEDQLTDWTPDAGGSPDRLDAMVWGLHELSQGGGTFMDGWLGQTLEQIATAKQEHPGMSAQEVCDRFNPLRSQPYDVADLDAQLKAQQQVPDTRFRSKNRTFGELKDLAMQNNRVTTYRTKLPDSCPVCANVGIAKYDSWARCATCGWDSRNVVVTPPQVAETPKLPAPKREGFLDFLRGNHL
jgi:phage terminase large subunit-like protein